MLVLIFSVSYWAYLFLLYTTSFICYEFEANCDDTNNVLRVLIDWIYALFFWAAILVAFCRYILIFYMMNYNVAVINNKWQCVLDPNIGQQNWYLRNVKKWGNFKWFIKWLILYFIIAYSGAKMTYLYPNDMTIFIISQGIFALFTTIIPLTISIYILCNLPSFNDVIGMRKELKFCIWVLLIMMVSYLIFSLFYFEAKGYTEDQLHIAWYIYLCMLKIQFFTFTLRHTRQPLIIFASILNDRYSAGSISMKALAHKSTYDHLDRQYSEKSDKDNKENAAFNKEATALRREIKDFIRDPEMFDAFMQHLLNEYCGECLLSIVEFTQYKTKMKEEFEDIEFEDDEEIMIELPEKMVKSKIVYDREDYQVMAFDLYEKYIRVSAEWEININYRDRNKYKEAFEGKNIISDDKKELYVLFDTCLKQMFSLLLGSYTRFKSGKQYQMINEYSPPLIVDPQRSLSDAIYEHHGFI